MTTVDVLLTVWFALALLALVLVRVPRLRVWIALQLCRNTGCVVARYAPTYLMAKTAGDLLRYVERSGALQEPKRVKAYRVVSRGAMSIMVYAQDILAGPFPKKPKEEKDASQEDKEEESKTAA